MAKKKRKKKGAYETTCVYCVAFQNSKNRTVNEVEDREKNSRHCFIIDEYITSYSLACESFILCKYFWCEACGYRISIETCLGRKICTCKSIRTCKQRDLLERISK